MPDNPDTIKMRGEQLDVSQFLQKIYMDEEIVVAIAPDDTSLERLILDIVKERGRITFKELRSMFSGISSEDKIKRAISKLASRNRVYLDMGEDGVTIYPVEL